MKGISSDSKLLHKAIEFSALAHKDQLRKGTDIPYISHPFEVAQILTENKCSQEVIVAGLLHDTVEDAGISIDEIGKEFGATVAYLVSALTENKSKSWEDRKKHTIESLEYEEDDLILQVFCADKLSNLRSIKAEYDMIGDKVFDKFNKGKSFQSWYYSKLIDALEPLARFEMYWELSKLYKTIFVKYYLDTLHDVIIQTNQNETYGYSKKLLSWNRNEKLLNIIETEYVKSIDMEDAVNLEISWRDDDISKMIWVAKKAPIQ